MRNLKKQQSGLHSVEKECSPFFQSSARRRTAVVILSAVIVVLAAVSVLQRQQETKLYTGNLFAMDTYFSMKAYGRNAQEGLLQCEEKVRELEACFSVTAEGSDIWRVDHRQSTPDGQTDCGQTEDGTSVQEDTFRLISEAVEIGRQTEGALDITLYPVLREWGFTTGAYRIPESDRLRELQSRVDYRKILLREEPAEQGADCYRVMLPDGAEIDLGAVAKGYTSDAMIGILREKGVRSAILDLGGNVQTLGAKPDGSPWQVAVRDPFDREQILGVLSVTDKCVITSGGYERFFIGEDGEIYWHILDPTDGMPAKSGLVSVTIVGERGVRCDALSTALFVMGEEKAVAFWQEQGDFEMLLVAEDGRLIITEGLKECFVPADVKSGQMEIVYVFYDSRDADAL